MHESSRDWFEELRQRAMVIEGFAHLLVSGVAPERATEHAARILGQARALRHLLTLDGGEAGAPEPDVHTAPTDLARLVRGTVAEVADRARPHPVQVSAGDGPVLSLDADGVGGVLGALLAHAWRHSPPGATIEVDVRGTGTCAEVVVTHPGALAPEVVPGLYRGRRVARAHGGDLTVTGGESGTSVVLRLPLP